MPDAPLSFLDHATYDQYLMALHEPHGNWASANLRGNTPLAKDVLVRDTQHRLTEWLKTQPLLGEQDWSDKRPLLRHLSHHVLSHAALHTHHFAAEPKQMIQRVRNNLAVLLRFDVLWLDTEDDPMKGFKARRIKLPPNSNEGAYYDTYQDKQHLEGDKRIARHLLAERYHEPDHTGPTEELLKEAVPYLIELDRTKITIAIPELRNRIRAMLTTSGELPGEERIRILEEIMNDWIDLDEDGRIAYFETLQVTLNAMRADDDQIDIYDTPVGTIADACFQELTERTELNDADRQLLTERTENVLPFLIHRGVPETKSNPENLPELQRVYHYLDIIPPIIKPHRMDMPHLVLAKSVLQGDMTGEQYRGVLY